MRKTRRNRTPKELRKNDYPVVRKYRGKSYDNALCKNAILEVDKKTKKVSNSGCKNLRANGSSHCVDCSYNHQVKKYEKRTKNTSL